MYVWINEPRMNGLMNEPGMNLERINEWMNLEWKNEYNLNEWMNETGLKLERINEWINE